MGHPSRWSKLAEEVREEIKNPPSLPISRRRKGGHTSAKARASVMVRWESVRAEREEWLQPFHKLPIERAMAYLEDLRKICETAGEIMNERLSKDVNRMSCACGCGVDLAGTKANGFPKWIKKMDSKDKRHPKIWHSLYFAEAICVEKWTRRQQAPCKCGHVRSEHGIGLDQSCTRQDCECRKYGIADRKVLEPTGIIS